MKFNITHILNKTKWSIQNKILFISTCCSNILYDFPLFLKLKKVIIINSWIDFKNGKIQQRNFGDDLNYFLLKDLTNLIFRFKDSTILSKIKRTNYLCIGSIIHLGNRHSVVWGAGCISKDSPIPKPKQVLAVRGPKTRERLIQAGIHCPETYGDPALILPLVYNPNIKKQNHIGIILNSADEVYKCTIAIQGENEYKYISFTNYTDWRKKIDEVIECQMILSSSLHGLIIADAYNIPNIWISINDCENIIGGYFKYLDYFSSVCRHQTRPIELNTIMEQGITNFLPLIEKPIVNLTPLLKSCPFELNI